MRARRWKQWAMGITCALAAFVMGNQADARRRCICPAVYKPVCGTNGKTYSNSCRASCARVGIAYRGRCGKGGKIPRIKRLPRCPKGHVWRRIPVNCRRAPCPTKYRCVKRPKKKRLGNCPKGTYLKIIRVQCVKAPCPSLMRCVPLRKPPTMKPRKKRRCVCTAEYKPVCGTNGKTYSNSCHASCAGVGVARRGSCKAIKPPKPPKRR